jgi:hypothetical protein
MTATTIDIGPRLTAVALVFFIYLFARLGVRARRDLRADGGPPPGAPAPVTPPGTSAANSATLNGFSPVDPVSAVCTVVVERYGVGVEALMSPSRAQPAALARQISMRLVRELTDLSYSQIGERFARDHSTVIHAITATDGMLLEDLRQAASAAITPSPQCGGGERPGARRSSTAGRPGRAGARR